MACFDAGLDLLQEMLCSSGTLADSAWTYLIQHSRTLLSYRQLKRLESLIIEFPIPQTLVAPLLEQVENFLQYECGGDRTESNDDLHTYCEEVRAWRGRISPTDFAERLQAIVGKESWHHDIREDIWKTGSEIDPIAEELVTTPGLLEESLDYLCSPEARSAVPLGTAIGRRDIGGAFLDRILAKARHSRCTALLRGYVAGLLIASPEQAVRVNQILDSLETEDAPVAAEMMLGALELTDSPTRILRMVSAGRLSFETNSKKIAERSVVMTSLRPWALEDAATLKSLADGDRSTGSTAAVCVYSRQTSPVLKMRHSAQSRSARSST